MFVNVKIEGGEKLAVLTEQNRTELFIWLFQPGDYALRLYFSRYHASHHIIHKTIQYSKIYRQ